MRFLSSREPRERRIAGLVLRVSAVLVFSFSSAAFGCAQETPSPGSPQEAQQNPAGEAPDDPLTTMFPHAEWDRLWLSGQANFISEWHPAFHSPYQGKNSLPPEAQDASSRVLTFSPVGD